MLGTNIKIVVGNIQIKLGKTSKKNGKENDIVQKGGGVRKNQIKNVSLKVTFY